MKNTALYRLIHQTPPRGYFLVRDDITYHSALMRFVRNYILKGP